MTFRFLELTRFMNGHTGLRTGKIHILNASSITNIYENNIFDSSKGEWKNCTSLTFLDETTINVKEDINVVLTRYKTAIGF